MREKERERKMGGGGGGARSLQRAGFKSSLSPVSSGGSDFSPSAGASGECSALLEKL